MSSLVPIAIFCPRYLDLGNFPNKMLSKLETFLRKSQFWWQEFSDKKTVLQEHYFLSLGAKLLSAWVMLRDNSHFLLWSICKHMKSSLWILKTAVCHSVIQRFFVLQIISGFGKYLGTKAEPDHSSRKVLLLARVAIISALWSLILGGLTFALPEQECQATFKDWPKNVCRMPYIDDKRGFFVFVWESSTIL